jgi:hypothetical protein
VPENPTLVINIEDNEWTYMHSIDASEAVRMGDYRYATADEQNAPNEKKATALNRMRNVNVNPHPEMQTPEQRAATRAQAAEEARAVAAGEVVEPLGVRQALGAPVTPTPPEQPPRPPAPTPTPPHPPEESSRRARS